MFAISEFLDLKSVVVDALLPRSEVIQDAGAHATRIAIITLAVAVQREYAAVVQRVVRYGTATNGSSNGGACHQRKKGTDYFHLLDGVVGLKRREASEELPDGWKKVKDRS